MYVFPHLADGNTPVPGYSTVFPFYSQVQYALPGERTDAAAAKRRLNISTVTDRFR